MDTESLRVAFESVQRTFSREVERTLKLIADGVTGDVLAAQFHREQEAFERYQKTRRLYIEAFR